MLNNTNIWELDTELSDDKDIQRQLW